MRMTAAEYEAYQARRTPAAKLCAEADAYTDESKLHEQISDYCLTQGWLAFHGSMAHKTKRRLGEPDFFLLLPNGRFLMVECKSKTGKLSTEQQGVIRWAAKLGHTVRIICSFAEFLALVK